MTYKVEKMSKKFIKISKFWKNPQLITVKNFNFYIFMTPKPSTFKIWWPILWWIFLVIKFYLAQCVQFRLRWEINLHAEGYIRLRYVKYLNLYIKSNISYGIHIFTEEYFLLTCLRNFERYWYNAVQQLLL